MTYKPKTYYADKSLSYHSKKVIEKFLKRVIKDKEVMKKARR